ncbi:MAG: cadherin-like beta sandwich domain-containing protein [Acidobacteria bacterium]|nr:cadherin-like beta sandwich domain-containing protein [Acidobacteriota bacterium]
MTSSNRNASGFRQLASPTGWYWLAGALVLGAPAVVSAQGAVADDRAALEALYDATDGVNWVSNDNWKTEEPLGEWHGVTTDSTGRVTRLELGDNEMSGTLPAELGNLTSLEYLWFNRNQLSGPIPAELGNLTSLEVLVLNRNRLVGTIPHQLANLSSLETLALWGNQLSGPIPAELRNLTSLVFLVLGDNQLSGRIPSELGNLANLEHLSLGNNGLSGTIPSQIWNLTRLTHILAHGNELSGTIPSQVGNLTNLTSVRLGDNQLSGPIPAELGNATRLQFVWLAGNRLSGPIPAELGNLADLLGLRLNDNQLTGQISAALGNLTNLTDVRVDTATGLCLAPDFDPTSPFATLSSLSVCPPAPGEPADVQAAVDDAIAAATNGEGLRSGDASVTVPLDALFTFPSPSASAVAHRGSTFSASSSAPGVVSVSTSLTDAGPALELTPGADAGTATVTVDARPEGQPDAPLTASVMFEVRVARALVMDATLSGLVLSDGMGEVALTPAFDPGTQSYTVAVANSVTSVTVTATVADDSATVTVNGVAVASGSPGDAIDLAAGENVITVLVTAGDGTTTLTYTVTVTRSTVVPALPLGGALLLGILLVCLGGRRILQA